MIKISICFIVNEVRQAGTSSHSAGERQKDSQPNRRERIKEWYEEKESREEHEETEQ